MQHPVQSACVGVLPVERVDRHSSSNKLRIMLIIGRVPIDLKTNTLFA